METRCVTRIRKLMGMLPTREGLTLRVGTQVDVTDEYVAGWQNMRFRVVLVSDARYHVRAEDLAYACGDL
jgi:hypothetical protein